jgi:hypothetical protein
LASWAFLAGDFLAIGSVSVDLELIPNWCAVAMVALGVHPIIYAVLTLLPDGHKVLAGRWVDFWTFEMIQGPQTCWVEVLLEVLPLYIQGDALSPTIESTDHLTEDPFNLVTFDGYRFD